MTDAFVLLAIRITLVLAAALVAARLLRRRPAAVRHAVLTAAVLAAAALPAITPLAPGWWSVPMRQRASVDDTATAVVTAVRVTPDAPVAPTSAPMHASRLDARRVVIGIWMLGALLAAMRLARDGWRLREVAAHSTRLNDARWAQLLATLPPSAATRAITVRVGSHDAPIATWGWRKPIILVPADAVDWPDAHVRHVLAHECAHITRADWAWHLLLALAGVIYWWHPLMHVATRAARSEAEHACDDAVLADGGRTSAYASTLLHVARTRRAASTIAAVAMAETSSLERRISAMFDTSVDHSPVRPTTRALLASACLVFTIAIAGLGAQAPGTVSGTVSPAGGTPLEGVTIGFTGPAALEVVTDGQGQFTASLPAGTYRAEIKRPGFKAFAARVDVAAGERVTRDFALALGTVRESISVVAATRSAPANDKPFHRPAPVQVNPFAGVLDPPKKIKDVKPVYPEELKAGGIGGKVALAARIGVDGFVTDVQIVSSPNDALSAAAVTAVEQWKFTPTLLQGKPVPTEMTISIDFSAQ